MCHSNPTNSIWWCLMNLGGYPPNSDDLLLQWCHPMSPLNMKKNICNIRVYESEVDMKFFADKPSFWRMQMEVLFKKTGASPHHSSQTSRVYCNIGGGTLKEVHFHALRSSSLQCNLYIYMYGSTLVDIMEHEHQWEHPFWGLISYPVAEKVHWLSQDHSLISGG